MSNHSGSYQLNEILDLLDREKVFDFWGKEKTRNLLKEMVNLARRKYDCNSGEILEGYTERFGICYGCLSLTDNLNQGLCHTCSEDKG